MSPRDLDTLVFLADRVIVVCAPSYQYNSYIIIIISTLYDNQFGPEVGRPLYGRRCENSARRTRRSVTLRSPVGRKSDTFGVPAVLTSACPFVEVTTYVVLRTPPNGSVFERKRRREYSVEPHRPRHTRLCADIIR